MKKYFLTLSSIIMLSQSASAMFHIAMKCKNDEQKISLTVAKDNQPDLERRQLYSFDSLNNTSDLSIDFKVGKDDLRPTRILINETDKTPYTQNIFRLVVLTPSKSIPLAENESVVETFSASLAFVPLISQIGEKVKIIDLSCKIEMSVD